MTTQLSQESATSSLVDGQAAKKRQQWSCDQCRGDKQKCKPVERDWTLREKCVRCEKLGHACGPPVNITAQRKRKKKEFQLSSARATPETMALRDLANLSQPAPEIVMNPTFGMSSQSARPQPFVVDVGSNSKTPGPAKANEIKTRAALSYLEDILVMMSQLAECSDIIDEAERRGGDPNVVRRCRLALDEAKYVLHMEFYAARLQFQECRKEKEVQFRRELTERFKSVSQAFQQIGATDKISPYGDHEQDMHDIQKNYRQDRRAWDKDPTQASMAFHIREGALIKSDLDKDIDKDLATLAEAATRLSKISNVIARNISAEARELLFPLQPSQSTTSSKSQPSFRFPAVFLALKYTSPELLSRFVAKRGKYLTEKGLFGLTALQVAVYTHQLHKLEKTFEDNAGQPLALCHNDIFSLTPILVAGFRNDISAFKLLHEHHANTDACDHQGRSVRVICATQDSMEVMAYILEQNIWMFSTWSDLLAAIIAKRPEMAKRLAEYYTVNDQIRADSMELILFAKEQAEQQSQNTGESAWKDVARILADGAQFGSNAFVQNGYNVTAAVHNVETVAWDETMEYVGHW